MAVAAVEVARGALVVGTKVAPSKIPVNSAAI